MLSNKLLVGLKKNTSVIKTENGANTYSTSLNYVLDYFAIGSAMRERTEDEIYSLFDKAYIQDPLLATKALFYSRDVRGGQGERRAFRAIIKGMALRGNTTLKNNLKLIAEYGRWDDMLELLETPLSEDVLYIINEQFQADINSESPSLLAKWLPSINTSSKETKRLAEIVRKYMKLSPKNYRKSISALRKKINVVEQNMSAREWGSINYEHVPSVATKIYRNAFSRHDNTRYKEYLQKVSEGKAKINSSTLYPSDIISAYNNVGYYGEDIDGTLEAQWKALPNYVKNSKENAIVVADVSGSMTGKPMDVSIALAIYFAERNKGPFKDCAISFSRNPNFIEAIGSTLIDKIRVFKSMNIAENTDIIKVFKLILNTAMENNVSQEDMINKIFIVSDMEFDSADDSGEYETNYNIIKHMYFDAGFVIPQIVFWNVNARQNQFPVRYDEKGTALVSGYSPSIFENLLAGEILNPVSIMLTILNKERYNQITI